MKHDDLSNLSKESAQELKFFSCWQPVQEQEMKNCFVENLSKRKNIYFFNNLFKRWMTTGWSAFHLSAEETGLFVTKTAAIAATLT